MSKVYVVNAKDTDYDVFIGRPSIWGNPFKIGLHGTREEVIEKYRQWFYSHPHLMELAKKRLPGMVLGCYCKPKPCHGDVLAEFLNNKQDATAGE